MKMKLLVLLLTLLSDAAAAPQDMSDKMFIFSEKSKEACVKVKVTKSELNAVTLCHRSFTDLRRSHTFVSLTTPSVPYGYETFYNYDSQELSVWVKSVRADFGSVDYVPNKWYSICTTWDSSSGLVQLWINGQPYTKKYNAEFPITGTPQIILGQEQGRYDKYTGFLDIMSFVGTLTDVHMWDHVVSPCEIHKFMSGQSFTGGNVFNWNDLDFEKQGRIMVEEKQTCALSTL